MILAINPGSTSTKIALFQDETLVIEDTLRHSTEELKDFHRIMDQKEFRKEIILDFMEKNQYNLKDLVAVVARGGLLRPITGGTYLVNEQMILDLEQAIQGDHASNLGAMIAKEIADPVGIMAYIVDPVVVDELEDVARFTGLPEIQRLSIFHALNQKAVANLYGKAIGKPYDKMNLIVAHMGGGISVGAHHKGRTVEVNNALDGDGPMSPERSGDLPNGQLLRLFVKEGCDMDKMKKHLKGDGGLVAHLGTVDLREVEAMIKSGDTKAKAVFEAMAYQVSKAIGACSAVLCGDVDGILLTGGMAHSQALVESISRRVRFIAPIKIYPGEDEMNALVQGVLRVMNGTEKAKIYGE